MWRGLGRSLLFWRRPGPDELRPTTDRRRSRRAARPPRASGRRAGCLGDHLSAQRQPSPVRVGLNGCRQQSPDNWSARSRPVGRGTWGDATADAAPLVRSAASGVASGRCSVSRGSRAATCERGWVAQLGHRLGLDLADPLAGHAVDLADLVERLGLAVGEAEAHRDHAGLALGEGVEHRVQLLLQQGEADRVGRARRPRSPR